MDGSKVTTDEIGSDKSVSSGGPSPSLPANSLSALVICPQDSRRRVLVKALAAEQVRIAREFSAYPSLNDLTEGGGLECDLAVIDIDGDLEAALALVENVGSHEATLTVMVSSSHSDPERLVRSMRAGAREFLPECIAPADLSEALVRAAARRLERTHSRKLGGKVLVFWGAKGGLGATTLASNFAIALKQETGREVALVDLDVELGDVSVLLALNPRFTIRDALRNPARLDREFVSTLLAPHSSGVSVLAAADEYTPLGAGENGHLQELFRILGEQFPYVVVDAGPGLSGAGEALAGLADSIYLIVQADVPSLRNAQRLISYWQGSGRRLEVVLNRFEPRRAEIEQDQIAKALGIAPTWRVPNDYAGVRRSQNTGVALALENSPVSRVLQQMARAACGKAAAEKKKRFSLFG